MQAILREVAPETRLALLLARTQLDEDQRRESNALASSTLDWNLWLAVIERHGLAPLARHHLEALDAPAIPKPVRARLWARAEATARRNAVFCRELGAIVACLEGEGVPVVPYKGPSLAVRAYGDVALREFGDLDFLVRSRDVLRAKALLRRRGYVAERDVPPAVEEALVRSARDYELALVDRASGVMAELHWRADPDARVPALDDESWWPSLPRTDVCGVPCAGLSTEDLLLVLCLHGSKHFWWSIGWMVDVAELARREPADWRRIAEMAQRHGCGRRLALAVVLIEALLGERFAGVEALPLRDRAVLDAARKIAPRLFWHHDAPFPPMTAFRLNLALCDGPLDALAAAWKAAFTPGWGEWLRWPLPRPLFFLYRVLRPARLAAKYALRFGAREPELAPRLVDGDRHGIGEVEAAVPGPHRQA